MKNLEQLKENYTKIDFNEWIGRVEKTLIIKWDKFLASYKDWGISYMDKLNSCSSYEIHYEETTLDKLEKWDVFICKEYVDVCKTEDFNIFIWKDEDWVYILNYLLNNEWYVEFIDNICIPQSRWQTEVIKFLRK